MVRVLLRYVVFGLLKLISIAANTGLQATLQESCQDQPLTVYEEILW